MEINGVSPSDKDSKLIGEAYTSMYEERMHGRIRVLKDIYYSDAHGLTTKHDVDGKFHDRLTLIYPKGYSTDDDREYEDSEYTSIVSSNRLTRGIDYEIIDEEYTSIPAKAKEEMHALEAAHNSGRVGYEQYENSLAAIADRYNVDHDVLWKFRIDNMS